MSRDGTVKVFVYGSLLPGLSNHEVAKPYLRRVDPGTVRGRLADLGPYPALLPGLEGRVRGMWFELDKAGLPALDRLEDFKGIEETNDYERVWITDADSPSLAGWVYIWTETRGYPLADGDWWPDILAGKRDKNRPYSH